MATGTTVGYGDVAPKQEATRLFGCFYVFMVVAVTARIVGKISDVFLSGDGARDVQAILGKKPDAAWLRSLDTDGSGDVTAIEYLSAMLVRLQYVEQDKIDQIMRSFHKLDSDGSGTLSIEDLVQDMGRKPEEEDEEDESKEQKVAPGGRYSFSGPIGGLIVHSGGSQLASTLASNDINDNANVDETSSQTGTQNMIEEAEALLFPETETVVGKINEQEKIETETGVVTRNTNAPNMGSTTIATTKKQANDDDDDDAELAATATVGDARVESTVDVLEKATEVLSLGGNDPSAPIQAVADDADKDGAVLGHATAMYDFIGESEGELGFKRGDILDVTELDNSDGWWHGSLNGKWGSFPFEYVYCNLQHAGVTYLLLPRDFAVHESAGKKEKIGTFDYDSKVLKDNDGIEQDWTNATLL